MYSILGILVSCISAWFAVHDGISLLEHPVGYLSLYIGGGLSVIFFTKGLK